MNHETKTATPAGAQVPHHAYATPAVPVALPPQRNFPKIDICDLDLASAAQCQAADTLQKMTQRFN